MRERKRQRRVLFWWMARHSRWFRRYWLKIYKTRVRMTERELGGKLYVC